MPSMKTKIGTLVSFDHPQIACHLSSLGYDFIFIDLEHGHVSDTTIASIILSKKERSKVFIRIKEITEGAIKSALDLGCDGIIAPRVESLEEIRILINYSYYPPMGQRSVGFSLANTYGHTFKQYQDNFKPIILPQIESVDGLAIAKDILSHKEIDGVFIGPYDLSASLGVPGQFESDNFVNAYESVRQNCQAADKLFCTFCVDVQTAKKEIEKGTDLIAIGVDAHLFLTMYTQMIDQVKRV